MQQHKVEGLGWGLLERGLWGGGHGERTLGRGPWGEGSREGVLGGDLERVLYAVGVGEWGVGQEGSRMGEDSNLSCENGAPPGAPVRRRVA